MKTRLQNNCKNLQIRVIFFCEQRYWQIVGDRKAATFILLVLDEMMRMGNDDKDDDKNNQFEDCLVKL